MLHPSYKSHTSLATNLWLLGLDSLSVASSEAQQSLECSSVRRCVQTMQATSPEDVSDAPLMTALAVEALGSQVPWAGTVRSFLPVIESACGLPSAVIAECVACDIDDAAFESFQLVTGKSRGRPALYVASLSPFRLGADPAHPFTALYVSLRFILTAWPQTLPVRSARRVHISALLHADLPAGRLPAPSWRSCRP